MIFRNEAPSDRAGSKSETGMGVILARRRIFLLD